MDSIRRPVYVLGTGLSHNGSAVLLKDGRVCVAIEKERLTRRKHDGGNDTACIRYCLETEGIDLADLELVVQTANFEIPARDRYRGPRLFAEVPEPPLYSISHHLAHAYSAVGTCPFDSFNVLVVDGCGSPFQQCTDLEAGGRVLGDPGSAPGRMLCEKDSFYHYDGNRLRTIAKDFSEMAGPGSPLPTTRHSIGGYYAAVSRFCFGDANDPGKLMGLAAFGRNTGAARPAFFRDQERLFLRADWESDLARHQGTHFQEDFQGYADLALHAQTSVEAAVLELFRKRNELRPCGDWAYSGGVALNAVANGKIQTETFVKRLYVEPAAGDAGLALGCAYFGWLEILKRTRVRHDGSTCFGKDYGQPEIARALERNSGASVRRYSREELYRVVARELRNDRVVGWFQSGSEFGPRALGRRSILAAPWDPKMQEHINARVKFREDFRPFAPAVQAERYSEYFQNPYGNPYMLAVDRVRPAWRERLRAVCHVDGTARAQAVHGDWNPAFAELLREFERQSGVGVLLNTSLNRKNEPIVETPEEAVRLFETTALDLLVLEDTVLSKH